MTTVKMLAEGRVGGYLVVWGGPNQPDLHGEYFTPETQLYLDWFATRPVLYHHGLDGTVKAAIVGVLDTLRADDVGLWAEAQLDLRERYVQAVHDLVDRGVLGWSSGSLPHLVKVAQDGRITHWPIVEGSLTPTPAEPRHTDVQTLKSAYAALGLDFSRLVPSADAVEPSTPAGAPDASSTKTTHKGGTMPTKRLPHSTEDAQQFIEVGSPFDALSAEDMLHGYMLLSNAQKGFRGVSERYANALATKLGGVYGLKADDIMGSTVTGAGDEWVPQMWSSQIWNRARQENAILGLFQSIEMPSNPFELPAEGADPTVYFVAETKDSEQLTLGDETATAIPTSTFGTATVTLDAKKLALRVGFAAELVEDAITPVLSLYREQAVRAILTSIDHVLLNGDTASSGNINGSPDANDRVRAFDGLRKTALANSVTANAAPSLTNLRAARFTMPARHAARPSDLAWIVDSSTYAALLNISEFLTMDKAGEFATNVTGQIGLADGAPVVVSAEMPLTDTDGTVSGTPANNVNGTALCVYRPGWYVGYRRRIAVSVNYLPFYDAYQLTATVRLAFKRFDSEVASALVDVTV